MDKRRRTLVKDTPEKSGIDVTIVEDSVFDTSQVPDTAERTRTLLGGAGRVQELGRDNVISRKISSLPSFLPGEETFVVQSQKMALSSTVLQESSGKSARTNKSRRKSSRRSNVTQEDLMSFILNRHDSPPAIEAAQDFSRAVPESDSDSSEDEWDKMKSVHGSVQKYLPKALDARKSTLISGNVKSRKNARSALSEPKSQDKRRVRVVKNLADDLKRRSLVNETIEEVTEEISETSSSGSLKSSGANSHINPKLLVQSYQNFSTDSAKALIAQMENGEYTSDKSAGGSGVIRTSSASSCEMFSQPSPQPRVGNPVKGTSKPQSVAEATSLSPVPMDVVTPAIRPGPVLSAMSSPSLRVATVEECESPGPTQRPPVLEGVKIFVDFRTGHENLGGAIEKKAAEIGATIAKKLTGDVTHVIFKDGSLVNYKKAKKLGAHIVSMAWLEKSRVGGMKMAESEFPSVSSEKYDSPGLFPKLRKLKSMQPKTIEEDYQAASKSVDRKLKIQAKKDLLESGKKDDDPVSTSKRPPHNHYYKGCEKFYNRNKAEPSSLQELMKEIQSPARGTPVKLPASNPASPLSLSPSATDVDTPLAVRLARMYQSPLERSRLRKESVDSNLSSKAATPIKTSEEITLMGEGESTSKENQPLASSISNDQKTNNDNRIEPKKRGRKRKVTNSPAKIVSNEQLSSLERRSPLRDLSNATCTKPAKSRHKLFPQKQSQVLDETFDDTQSSKIGYIENVHITAKKQAPVKSKVKEKKVNSKQSTKASPSEKVIVKPVTSTRAKRSTCKATDRRKSSFDFLPPPKFSQSSSSNSSVTSQLSTKGGTKLVGYIALTSCDKEDKQLVKQLVKKLGAFGFHETISEKTTHVVCGDARRTINLVKGLVRGCWILSKEWVLASLESGMWLKEKKFELKEYSSASRTVREERKVFGESFKSRLFAGLGPVYISAKCRVARTDLRQLITWGGGELVNTARVAAVVVGEFCHVGDSNTPHFVADKWILDSVQNNMVMPFLDYPLE